MQTHKGGKGERDREREKKQREGTREREREEGGGREMLRYLDIFTFSREGFLLKLFCVWIAYTITMCSVQ